MYYKKCLPLELLDIIFLYESIVFDLRIRNKLYSFISLYRSPNQSYDDFVSFYKVRLIRQVNILYILGTTMVQK